VISTVVRDVDLRAAEPRSERARKSAIAFVPDRHAMVVAGPVGHWLPGPASSEPVAR
jgi:hypothetical protein